MASRENQGLQIALILFVMVTIGLAVTAFIFYKNGQEANRTAEDADRDAKQNRQALEKVVVEIEQLKTWIGHPPDEELDRIKKDYDEDMMAFEVSLPKDERNYRDLPKHLMTAVIDKNTSLVAKTKEVEDLLKRIKEVEGRVETQIADARKIFIDAADSFKTDRVTYTQRISAAQDQQNRSRKDYETAKKQAADIVEEKEAEISDLADTLAKTEQMRVALTQRASAEKTNTFEEPDGKIVSMNTRDNTVWINLGRADNLGRQVTFSVHGKGTSNVMASEHKATVEVTRILNDHLAEARIVEDAPSSDPILPGDVVFSPAWSAGRELRFALAGFLDIDGNGKSDRTEVESLILSNNGVIESKMTYDTTYLVVGKRPDEKAGNQAIDEYSAMEEQAYEYGIEKISLQKLLNMMGYEGKVQSVSLGRHARSEDFKAKPAGGVARPSSGSTFQPRERPRSAYK